MLAEIHHKIRSNSEDVLTGNFFGTLRYLPFQQGFGALLEECIQSKDHRVEEILNEMKSIREENISFEFWKRSAKGLGEIDLYVQAGTVSIGIEVKYQSGLSGREQLEREASMLQEWGNDHRKLLILWAPETEAKEIYLENVQKPCFQKTALAFVTWEDAAEALSRLTVSNRSERCMLEDLQSLMKEKGFYSFNGFYGVDEIEFPGTDLGRGEIMHKSFQVVYETLKSIEKLMDRCRSELDETKYHMPMKRFMRYSSDASWEGWIYWSFILLFQKKEDGMLMKNRWINGPVYAVEFNLDAETCREPELLIAKMNFEDLSDWKEDCSPANHGLFYDAMHVGERYHVVKEQNGFSYVKARPEYVQKVKESFWGFQDLILCRQDLVDLKKENYKDRIFGTMERM